MMDILLLLLPFVFFALFNLSLTLLFKCDYTNCMPISMTISMMILYLSQFVFDSFFPGYGIILALTISPIPIYLYKHERIEWQDIKKGIAFYLGLCLFICVWDACRSFAIFDEFYFWGPMVKEMIRLDSFYLVDEANLFLHKDYPPFISLLQMLWCRLAGGYTEASVSMASHMFLLSCGVMPLFSQLGVCVKDIKKIPLIAFVGAAAFISIIMVFDCHVYRVTTTILTDILIATVFADVMILVYRYTNSNKIFDLVSISVLITAIIMIKQIGIGFIMIIMLYWIMMIILNKSPMLARRKMLLNALISLSIPVLFTMSWRHLVSLYGITGQFDLKGGLFKSIESSISNGLTTLQSETLSNYIEALLFKNITTTIVPLSYFAISVLLIAIPLALYFKNKELFSKRIIVPVLMASISCSVGFAILMGILYLFCFNEYEMRILASFERYMSSYLLGTFLFLLYFIAIVRNKQLDTNMMIKRLLSILLVALISSPSNTYFLLPQVIKGNTHINEERTAEVISSKTKKNSSIYVIYDTTKINPSWYGAYQVYLQYYSEERFFPWNIDLYNNRLDGDIKDAINECDYLFINDVNSNVRHLLKPYVNVSKIRKGQIYAIKKTSKTIRLQVC